MSDWIEKKLGELGEFRTSSVDKKFVEGEEVVRLLNYMDIYRNNFITSDKVDSTTSVKENQRISSEVRLGDVFFTPSSETPEDIGHSGVVLENLSKTVFSYHLSRFRISENESFDLRFRGYVFNAEYIRKQFYVKATGSTRFTISKDEFEKTIVKYPKNVNEQKKIAEILTSVDLMIELISLEIDKLKDLKKGMMQGLLTKGIGHTKFKDSPVGKIPDSWEYGSLGAYVKFSQGVQVDVEEQKNNPCADHVRFIRIVDYTQSTHDLRYISKENAKKGEVELEDVVMVRYGASTGFIGRGIRGAIANNMFTITPQKIVTKEYLYYFLKQDLVNQYISNVTAGSAMPAVNFDIVSKIEFYFPSAIEEQNEICRKFSALDKLIEIKNIKLEQCGSLKKGLMNDLLTGKVRVKV